MKNKPLEAILKKNKFKHLIKLLEKCENGRVIEIKAIKEEIMTNIKEVDKDVLGYLKDLHVKITFVKESEIFKSKNKFYKQNPECSSELHQIAIDKDIHKDDKIKLFEESKLGLFKIDEKSYVCCPSCSKIVHITHT